MISMMDMTSGEWESDCATSDMQLSIEESRARFDAYEMSRPLLAGLCEYVAEKPLHAGMPAMLATHDLDEFLSRM